MSSSPAETVPASTPHFAATSNKNRLSDRWFGPQMAWLPFAGLLLFVCGIYANSLRVPFLLDDRLTLVMEPTTHSWSNAARSGYGRRVGMLSFAANFAWGRTDVFGYHVVNLAIHLAAGTLLWLLSRRLLQAPGTPVAVSGATEPIAWTIAALWLAHPLQTNAVTYTVQRFESLASLGILAALYAVARAAAATAAPMGAAATTSNSTAAPQASRGNAIAWGGVAVLSGWLATQSKEIAIGLPILAVALDRVFFAGSWREVGQRRGWIHGGLAVASGILLYESRSAFVAGPAASAGFSVEGLTPWKYLRSQPAVLVHYLRLCFWPDTLCLDYGWPVSDSPALIYGWGAAIVALLAATAYACFRAPRVGFIGLAFFTILGPTSSFVPIADLAFEHRMYLPLASVAAAVVLAVHFLWRRVSGRESEPADLGNTATVAAATADGGWLATRVPLLTLLAAVVAVVGTLGYRTMTRNRELADSELLWRQCIAVNPAHVRPRVHYAAQLSAKGDYAGAIRECREALRLGTHAAELYSLMGSAFVKQGQSEEGERCYRAATEADPHFPMSWYNWATLCFQQSRYVEASRLFRKALAVHSVHVESWSGLGWSLELAGEPHEAAVCYRRALQIDPSLVVVSTRLADLLATSGDTSLRAPTEALRIVEPLAKQTRGRNPHILDTLAAALAANGRCPEAVRVVEAALKLSPDKGLRARLESRLAAYRAGKPIETIAPDQTVSADQAGSSEQSVSLSGDSVSGENSPPSQSVSPEEGR